MASIGYKHTRGTKIEKGTRQQRKHTLSPKAGQAQQYEKDTKRFGSAWEIERLDDNKPSLECEDDNLFDILTEDALPDDHSPQALSEVPLTDEEEWDAPEEPIHSHRPDPDDSPLDIVPWEATTISIVGHRAVFQIPDWAIGRGGEDYEARWESLSKVADWLTRDRQAFLRHPSYLNLAGADVHLTPPISVTQEGLHKLLALKCDKTTFGKHLSACRLVWPSRQFPLAHLYAREAALAWCAQAAIQRQHKHCLSRDSELGRPDIQPPKGKGHRAQVLKNASRGWTLGPVPFVQLLCALTKCKWQDVLSEYGNQIFFRG